MRLHLSYFLVCLVSSATALPQSAHFVRNPAQLAHISGPTAAPAIRHLSTGDTPHPQPALAEPVTAADPIPAGKKLISGTINEKGSGPLEGVIVATKDGKIVSGSMQDGQYYIEIPSEDSVLVFSLDGYSTRVIKLHEDDNEYSVTLQPAIPAPASPSGSSAQALSPASPPGSPHYDYYRP